MTDSDSCPATSFATFFHDYLFDKEVTLYSSKSKFCNNFSFLQVMLR